MSDEELKEIEKSMNFTNNNSEWFWILLIFMLAFNGWGSAENPKINELEKKVARLEGQMSMIGGKPSE